jgi:hypothetical protein
VKLDIFVGVETCIHTSHLSIGENICLPVILLFVTAHNISYINIFKGNGGNIKTTSYVASLVNE